VLTRHQYKVLGKPHHSRRRKEHMGRFGECTIEAGGMVSRSSGGLSAAAFLFDETKNMLNERVVDAIAFIFYLSLIPTLCLCNCLSTKKTEEKWNLRSEFCLCFDCKLFAVFYF
jgi:hypothetical protein